MAKTRETNPIAWGNATPMHEAERKGRGEVFNQQSFAEAESYAGTFPGTISGTRTPWTRRTLSGTSRVGGSRVMGYRGAFVLIVGLGAALQMSCLSCDSITGSGWWPFSRMKTALNWRTIPARPLEIPEILEHEEELGHIRISDAKYWKEQQRRWVTPSVKKRLMLDVFTGKFQAQIQDKIKKISGGDDEENFRWDRPLGCVFYTPSVWSLGMGGLSSWPLACSFEHDQGSKGLVKSLASVGADRDFAGHEARMSMAGAEFFVDSIGDASVMSVGDHSFKQAKPYLKRNIIDTSRDEGSSLEAVLFVGNTYRKLGALAGRGLAALSDAVLDPSSISPHASQMGQQGLKTGMTLLDDLAQIRLGAKVADERSVVFGDFRLEPESEALRKLFSSEKKEVIDPRFLARLPEKSFAIAAAAFDQGDKGAAVIQDILVDLLLFGEDGVQEEQSRSVLREILNPHDDANGQWAWALVPLAKGDSSSDQNKGSEAMRGAALVQLHKVARGKSARAHWQEQMSELPAVDTKGHRDDGRTRRVNFAFTADFQTVQGVEMDRLQPLSGGSGDEQGWDIQIGYDDDIVITVISSDSKHTPVATAISALQGSAALGEHWVFRSVASRFAGNHFGAALDLKRTREWALSFASGSDQQVQWDEMGKDLSDFWYVHRIDPEKGAAFEFSASPEIAHQTITQSN